MSGKAMDAADVLLRYGAAALRELIDGAGPAADLPPPDPPKPRPARRARAKVAAPGGNGTGFAGGEATDRAGPGPCSPATAADTFRRTDYGNAERLVAAHGPELRHCAGHGRWYAWNGAFWEPDETGEIVRRAKATVRAIYLTLADVTNDDAHGKLAQHAVSSERKERLAAMVKLAESEPGVAIRAAELDADPWLLGCDNGTVDLRTGELRPSRQGDLITKSTRIAFDPAAGCPRWEEFLDRFTVGRNDLIEFLWRAVGYSLTGNTREQCLFLLQGPPATGKSTFTEIVRRVLGDYALGCPVQTFMDDKKSGGIPNDVARLAGARFVVAAESEEGARLKESFVKQATGGEKLTARFMRAEFFDFQPTFKIWLATNHRPDVRETDGGVWRRMRLVPCTGVLADEDQRKGFADDLLAAEAPGILAWAVRGATAWLRDGLPTPPAIAEATQAYRQEQDVLATFFDDCCVIGGGQEELVQDMYLAYTRWAHANGSRPFGGKRFSQAVVARGFDRALTGPARRMGFAGIGLREEEREANMNGNERKWYDKD